MVSSAKLIGKNGKFTSDFSEEITRKKNDLIIDHECYSGLSMENLSEYAGRICYKSGVYGKKNRGSADYHKHILEYGHHSIYGHNVLTFKILSYDAYASFCVSFAGVPGWYPSNTDAGYYVTINFRFIENLIRKSKFVLDQAAILNSIYSEFVKKAPYIFNKRDLSQYRSAEFYLVSDVSSLPDVHTWYTFEVVTSRRVAQELTRHSFEAAISMESSRYSPILDNPMIFHPSVPVESFSNEIKEAKVTCDTLYKWIESNIYDRLAESKGSGYAKKQARGAATGFQMMAQSCTIIYSCSKKEFAEIQRQRLSDSADMEITDLVTKMLDCVNVSG